MAHRLAKWNASNFLDIQRLPQASNRHNEPKSNYDQHVPPNPINYIQSYSDSCIEKIEVSNYQKQKIYFCMDIPQADYVDL